MVKDERKGAHGSTARQPPHSKASTSEATEERQTQDRRKYRESLSREMSREK